MRVQVTQNSRSQWVAVYQSDWGDSQEVSDPFPTREEAVAFAQGKYEGVPILTEGLNLGSDAPAAPLPKVDPRKELLGPYAEGEFGKVGAST